MVTEGFVDFLADLKHAYDELRELYVAHDPMTPRYRRAQRRLQQLVSGAVFVGSKFVQEETLDGEVDEPIDVTFYEAAFYVESESETCGEYFVCEMAYDESEILEAELFCYYDGEDDSPCLADMDAARKLARKYHYEE